MEALLRPVKDPRAYLAVVYSVGRLPLAIFYLLFVLLGISLSFSLVWVAGFGVIFFVLFLLANRAVMVFERELGSWWFGFQLRPMSAATAAPGIWGWLSAFLRNPVTWKGLAYSALEIPVGLAIGAGFMAGLALFAGLAAAPFLYLVDTTTARPGDPAYGVLGLSGNPGVDLPLLVLAGGLGILVGVGLLHAGRGVVMFHEFLARTLLGVSKAQLDLVQAQGQVQVAHARAERSDQDRRELVVNMGHEIRTPIASIRGHAEALLDGNGHPSEEETRRYLEVIQRETERLGALVDDLLVVARGEAGELKLDLRPVNVGAVVAEVAETLAPIAQRDRKVKLVAQLPPAEWPLPEAWADRDRLTQVLMNLVRNGIAYTPEGGIVSIALSVAPGWLEITVADTGVGIAAEELPRIFDRFYRTDESRSRATGGFGLGLAISKDLVSAMAGTIEAQSEPGLGSRFIVRLRVAVAEVTH